MNKITYEERKVTYLAALTKWGKQAQTMMAIEEMAELTKEICKLFRGKADMESLADEIADATIMLEQLRLMYGINAEVCKHMDMKILRLQARLGMEPEKTEAEVIREKLAGIPLFEPDEFDLAMIAAAEAAMKDGDG